MKKTSALPPSERSHEPSHKAHEKRHNTHNEGHEGPPAAREHMRARELYGGD